MSNKLNITIFVSLCLFLEFFVFNFLLQGDDCNIFVGNCNDFMLSHKGMHALNGNLAQISRKERKKIKNEVKKEVQHVKKEVVAAQLSNIGNNVNLNTRKYRKTQRNYRFNNNNMNGYPIAIKRWLNLVCNPIHSMYPCKVPDQNNVPTYCFHDYRITPNETQLFLSFEDVTPVDDMYGVFFYQRYGPPSPSFSVGAERAYSTYAVPVSGTDKPILGDNSNDFQTDFEGELYGDIWNFSESMRLVSMGMRVNSLVEVVTQTDDQNVTQFFSGNIKQADYINWITQNDSTSDIGILELIQQSPGNYSGGNNDGASARFNIFQDKSSWFRFFDEASLASNQETGSVNSTDTNYPFILLYFRNPIPAENIETLDRKIKEYEKKNDVLNPIYKKLVLKKEKIKVEKTKREKDKLLRNKNYLNSRQRALKEKARNNLNKKLDQFIEKYLLEEDDKEEEKFSDSLVTVKELLRNDNKRNVGADVEWFYTMPIRCEMHWWLEGKLKLPTILTSFPKYIDPQFDIRFGAYAKQNLIYASNGKSFQDVIKTGEKGFKKFNRGRKAVGGIVRSVKTGISDLSKIANM